MNEQENLVEETPTDESPESVAEPVAEANPDESAQENSADEDASDENQEEAPQPVSQATENVDEPEASPTAEAAPPVDGADGSATPPAAGTQPASTPRESTGKPPQRGSSSAPAEYVRPTYRGRSRRVEGATNIDDIHFKNIPLLTKFLDPYGRILSRRKTRVSAKIQRRAVKAIKQARHLCLLPYTGEHMRVARKRRRR